MEFIKGIADQATEGNIVHISNVLFHPIAAENVATFVTEAAVKPSVNGIIEIAGPDRMPLPEFVDRYLKATNDPRKIVPNEHGNYYGARIGNTSLVPAGQAKLGSIGFEPWLSSQLQHA